jgi:hypothetical protein
LPKTRPFPSAAARETGILRSAEAGIFGDASMSVAETLFCAADLETSAPAPSGVQSQIWGLLGSLYPRGNIVERRSERRFPYPYLLRLHPVDDDGVTPQGESFIVVGKHLSENGLGFYHPKPIVQRRVIVSLETPNGVRLAFLMTLTWCRFTRHGWYESGGQFLQAVSPAVDA